MKLNLIFPLTEHELLWKDIVDEMLGEDPKVIPYALNYGQQDFNIFLNKSNEYHQGKNTDGRIPATTYFLMDDMENEIIGAVNIRHYLNEELLLYGGHIGYGIRPSKRRLGYATKILYLALEKCREMGMKRVLLTCNKDNIGSAKTIMKNNGVLENEVEQDGNVVQRYWIDLF